jgi:hypothetical protein
VAAYQERVLEPALLIRRRNKRASERVKKSLTSLTTLTEIFGVAYGAEGARAIRFEEQSLKS